eukprot:3932476-Rhodomonas_salina.1
MRMKVLFEINSLRNQLKSSSNSTPSNHIPSPKAVPSTCRVQRSAQAAVSACMWFRRVLNPPLGRQRERLSGVASLPEPRT